MKEWGGLHQNRTTKLLEDPSRNQSEIHTNTALASPSRVAAPLHLQFDAAPALALDSRLNESERQKEREEVEVKHRRLFISRLCLSTNGGGGE